VPNQFGRHRFLSASRFRVAPLADGVILGAIPTKSSPKSKSVFSLGRYSPTRSIPSGCLIPSAASAPLHGTLADDPHVAPRRPEEPIENTWLSSSASLRRPVLTLTGRRCAFGVEPALPSLCLGDNLERGQIIFVGPPGTRGSAPSGGPGANSKNAFSLRGIPKPPTACQSLTLGR
jgi:hypothetical protein